MNKLTKMRRAFARWLYVIVRGDRWELEWLRDDNINAEHLTYLHDQIETAIGILDGNEEPIDWRNSHEPELLRKLCEHLEAWNLKRGLNTSNSDSATNG